MHMKSLAVRLSQSKPSVDNAYWTIKFLRPGFLWNQVLSKYSENVYCITKVAPSTIGEQSVFWGQDLRGRRGRLFKSF